MGGAPQYLAVRKNMDFSSEWWSVSDHREGGFLAENVNRKLTNLDDLSLRSGFKCCSKFGCNLYHFKDPFKVRNVNFVHPLGNERINHAFKNDTIPLNGRGIHTGFTLKHTTRYLALTLFVL